MSKIKSTVSDILVQNNKDFVNSCNALKNALKKISLNNQKTATKITTVTTTELTILEKLIIAAHNLTTQDSKTHAAVANKSKTELKQQLSKVQLLLNEKNANIKNVALEKLQNNSEKKFETSLTDYGNSNKKIDKILQELFDIINNFYVTNKPIAHTKSTQHIIVDDKTKALQEKLFHKFNDTVKKMFTKANQLSYKNLENLEKAQVRIVENLTKKKKEILDKYNKSILAV